MVVARKFLSSDLMAAMPGVVGTYRVNKLWKVDYRQTLTAYANVFEKTGTFALVKLTSYRSTVNPNNGHMVKITVDGTLILTQTIGDVQNEDVLEYPIYAKTSIKIEARARYATVGEYIRAEILGFSA
jgi:hypothetical protein